MRLLSLCIYTYNYTPWFIPCLPGFFRWNSTQQSFSQRIRFVIKTEWKVPVFWRIIWRFYTLHSTYGEEANASKLPNPQRLTNLLGGSPVLNKEGGEVNSAFADGSAASFSAFPVLPCCTLKKRVISLFNETLKDDTVRRWHKVIMFYFNLNMQKVLLPNM